MNEARNLASLPFNVVNRLRSNLDTTRQLIAQTRGLAFDIQNMDQQFAQLPRRRHGVHAAVRELLRQLTGTAMNDVSVIDRFLA